MGGGGKPKLISEGNKIREGERVEKPKPDDNRGMKKFRKR